MASSAGGARAAGGTSFQAEVFAWWASRAIAGCHPGLELAESVRIDAVGCETGMTVDDVGISLSDDGLIVVQAKGGMRRLDERAQDLRDAMDQLVRAMTGGLTAGKVPRLVDPDRDRLMIATNQDSSRAFQALGEACDRRRTHRPGLPLEQAAVNPSQRSALATFLKIIGRSWVAITGHEPAEDEVRRFLHVVGVCWLDFGGTDGLDRQRSEQMLRDAEVRDRKPFTALTAVGVVAARQRRWLAVRELGDAVGAPSGVPGKARGRLRELTSGTLERLAAHRVLAAPEGPIRVQREIVAELQGHAGSFLVTAPPGAGKSGVMADLAEALAGDKVVLAVDAVSTDRSIAHMEWRLGADIAEVLKAWDGPGPATLMLDGLDAHRSGPSWLADLVDELRDTRWRVIASIREFDLDHSLRWRSLFAGSPVLPAGKNGSPRDRVRHAVVPGFDDGELSQVTGASPALASVLAAGDQRLRELLRNPFNMSIAAELIAPVGIRELAAMSAQVQILAAYWQARVEEGPGSYERRAAARDIVEQMARARSLEVVPGSAAGATEELVSRGVLEEAGGGRLAAMVRPVRFRHHIVFDYALAAGLLGPGTELADVLDADPDFVLFGRPAIDFHLADLWLADEDRASFWDTAFALARRASLLALAAAAAMAVQHAQSPADFERLISAAAADSAAAIVVRHLAGALGAAGTITAVSVAAWDELVGALGGAWLPGGQPQEIQAFLRIAWELDTLQPLPRPGPAAQAHAAAITGLLETGLSNPAANRWIADRVLSLIPGVLPLDSRALPLLRRCLDASVTVAWGLLPLRPVLTRLGDVAGSDGQTAALLAAAPFVFDASDHPDVPFGGSLIIPMREGWEQAHGSLRYTVAEDSWAAFDAVSPRWSTEALAAILHPLARKGDFIAPVAWNGVAAGIDCSAWPELSGHDHVSDLVRITSAAMASRAGSGSGNTASLRVWAARITHPGAWSCLLEAAADEPALAMELRSTLLETGGLFYCPGTRHAATRMSATLSPLIDSGEHAQLERIAIALPDGEADPRLKRILERARDKVLTALDHTRIQTAAAATRLRQLAVIENPGPGSPADEPAVSPSADHWSLLGIDPATVAPALTAITSAEAALADGSAEHDRWLALAAAAAAEQQFGAEPDLRMQLRYTIGRLISSLIGSPRMRPHDAAGKWAAGLLLALADDSALPPVPEDMC
jgi:hypothetical protein